jgi:hypothetical protein
MAKGKNLPINPIERKIEKSEMSRNRKKLDGQAIAALSFCQPVILSACHFVNWPFVHANHFVN